MRHEFVVGQAKRTGDCGVTQTTPMRHFAGWHAGTLEHDRTASLLAVFIAVHPINAIPTASENAMHGPAIAHLLVGFDLKGISEFGQPDMLAAHGVVLISYVSVPGRITFAHGRQAIVGSPYLAHHRQADCGYAEPRARPSGFTIFLHEMSPINFVTLQK